MNNVTEKEKKYVTSLKYTGRRENTCIVNQFNRLNKGEEITLKRCYELCNLKHSDIIKMDDKFVYFNVLGKGRKERTVFVKREVYEESVETYKHPVYVVCNCRGTKFLNDKLNSLLSRRIFKVMGRKF